MEEKQKVINHTDSLNECYSTSFFYNIKWAKNIYISEKKIIFHIQFQFQFQRFV